MPSANVSAYIRHPVISMTSNTTRRSMSVDQGIEIEITGCDLAGIIDGIHGTAVFRNL